MYVYVYICIYVCIHTNIYIYILCIYIYIYLNTLYTYTYIHMNFHIYTYVYICLFYLFLFLSFLPCTRPCYSSTEAQQNCLAPPPQPLKSGSGDWTCQKEMLCYDSVHSLVQGLRDRFFACVCGLYNILPLIFFEVMIEKNKKRKGEREELAKYSKKGRKKQRD